MVLSQHADEMTEWIYVRQKRCNLGRLGINFATGQVTAPLTQDFWKQMQGNKQPHLAQPGGVSLLWWAAANWQSLFLGIHQDPGSSVVEVLSRTLLPPHSLSMLNRKDAQKTGKSSCVKHAEIANFFQSLHTATPYQQDVTLTITASYL